MFKYQNQPILLRDILKDGWTLYNETIKYVWFWSFLISLTYIIPASLGYIGIYHIDQYKHFHFSWIGFFIFFISVFFSSYFIIIVMSIIESVGQQQKVSLRKSLAFGIHKLPIIYACNLIYYAIIVAGTILFLFPAVFLWILLIMFIPVVLFENRGIIDSFVISAKMVWGNWWQTFVALLIPSTITYALRNILRLPGWDSSIVFAIDMIVMTLVMPYFYTVLLVQYHNLRMRYALPRPDSTATRLQS